jgi:hypothetical protein
MTNEPYSEIWFCGDSLFEKIAEEWKLDSLVAVVDPLRWSKRERMVEMEYYMEALYTGRPNCRFLIIDVRKFKRFARTDARG